MGAPHIYSDSAEANRKRAVDRQITGGDASKEDNIDMNSEAYLKATDQPVLQGQDRSQR